MNIENIRKLTPYQDINGLLSDWVEGIKNILGGNVVGLYLSGSLAYGSKYGVALDGPDFNTLIPSLDIRDVRKASARDLFKEWEPKINDAEWISNSHYQSYLVLNLCRILYTVVGSEPGSKKVAAKWTKAIYPQWEDLIMEAEQWKFGMEMKRSDEVIAFIKFSIEKVNETGLLD